MSYHDQGHGGRARSARIRAAHDYEATYLDSLQRGRTDKERRRLVRSVAVAVKRGFTGAGVAGSTAAESTGEALPRPRLAE